MKNESIPRFTPRPVFLLAFGNFVSCLGRMRQVKLFRGLETEVKALEKEINEWLIHADCKVIQIFGNIAPQSSSHTASSGFLTKSPHAPSDIFLCIYYEADAPVLDPVHTPEIEPPTPETSA